jgi:N-acyl-D-aspartate/D-glutamate deacylase
MVAAYDLVIRGGEVVDGTGTPRRTADVAITDGKIAEVGPRLGGGRREIDADGAIVAPGFVDIHTHYDGQATWDERLLPSAWHGVTTVVMGNCGVGFAPVAPDDRRRLIELMEGVEDIPGTALHEGLSWEWNTFGEYLDRLDSRPHDIDFAAQLPHAALRVHVMGDRAIAGHDANDEDIATMAKLARDAVAAGAVGFSTSRTLHHKSITGELTPSYDAGLKELAVIAERIGSTGTGVLQLATDFVDVDVDFHIMETMARAAGRPLSVSVAQLSERPEAWRAVLDRITAANAQGLRMRGQVAARAIGLLMGLPCTLHPFMTNPAWLGLRDQPVAEQARAMRDPAVKAEILRMQSAEKNENLIGGRLIDQFDAMYELTDPPNYEPEPRDNLAERAARQGRSPGDLVYDLMVADEGRGLMYVMVTNWVDRNLDAVREMLLHPFSVPGLSDGGAHVGTICDVSFPTTLLELWSRDRPGEQVPLEFVVQRQARDTAQAVGFHDRGVLAPGYKADVNVIDFDRVRVRRPEVAYDLPGGGRRLLQRADGYLHTFVNGAEIYASGEPTEELPGRLVRGAQPAPG